MGRAKILFRLAAFGSATALIAASLSGCSRSSSIVIASKNFTEQVILGEIVAQHLENRLNESVDRRLNLGGTLLAHQALISGDIDIYPEYTGTALTAVLNLPPSSDARAVLETVRKEYRARWAVEWLDPLGFNNTFAIVIAGADARRDGITSISEAAARASGWRIAMGYEFQQRPDGLAGLMKTYDLTLDGSIKTMDLGLLYRALEQGDVNMVTANSTDGLLSVLDVRVLEDDRQYFPPYQAAILVRKEALDARPGLEALLQELSGQLSNERMQHLNYRVDGQHHAVREVAQSFLREMALLRQP